MKKKELPFTTGLFWDIDPATLNVSDDAAFIITRVLMRGTMQDWNFVKSFYSPEKIRNSVTDARYLDKKTLAFCSVMFSIPFNEFRCYTLRQSTPQAWPY